MTKNRYGLGQHAESAGSPKNNCAISQSTKSTPCIQRIMGSKTAYEVPRPHLGIPWPVAQPVPLMDGFGSLPVVASRLLIQMRRRSRSEFQSYTSMRWLTVSRSTFPRGRNSARGQRTFKSVTPLFTLVLQSACSIPTNSKVSTRIGYRQNIGAKSATTDSDTEDIAFLCAQNCRAVWRRRKLTILKSFLSSTRPFGSACCL